MTKTKPDDKTKAAFMLGFSLGMEMMCSDMTDEQKFELFDLIATHKHTARHVFLKDSGFDQYAVRFMLETFDKIASKWQ